MTNTAVAVCQLCGTDFTYETIDSWGRPRRPGHNAPVYCSKGCKNTQRRNRARELAADRRNEPEVEDVIPLLRFTELPSVTAEERYVVKYGKCHGDLRFIGQQRPHSRECNELKAICATCPAFNGCRRMVDRIEEEAGLPNHTNYYAGLWAGETPGERLARRKEAHALSA